MNKIRISTLTLLFIVLGIKSFAQSGNISDIYCVVISDLYPNNQINYVLVDTIIDAQAKYSYLKNYIKDLDSTTISNFNNNKEEINLQSLDCPRIKSKITNMEFKELDLRDNSTKKELIAKYGFMYRLIMVSNIGLNNLRDQACIKIRAYGYDGFEEYLIKTDFEDGEWKITRKIDLVVY